MKPRKDDVISLEQVLDYLQPLKKDCDEEHFQSCVILVFATLNQNFLSTSLIRYLPYQQSFISKCLVNFWDNGLWARQTINGTLRMPWRFNVDDVMQVMVCGMAGIGVLISNRYAHIISEKNKMYKAGYCYIPLPPGVNTDEPSGELTWGLAEDFWAGKI